MTTPHAKPRLFYDCPLKAAFMAKYFGMRFESKHSDALTVIGGDFYWKAGGGYSGPAYIHPESLHLLEPIEDDIILRTNGYCQQVGWQIGIPKAKAQLEAGATIIQRGGAAFHWPDREAA